MAITVTGIPGAVIDSDTAAEAVRVGAFRSNGQPAQPAHYYDGHQIQSATLASEAINGIDNLGWALWNFGDLPLYVVSLTFDVAFEGAAAATLQRYRLSKFRRRFTIPVFGAGTTTIAQAPKILSERGRINSVLFRRGTGTNVSTYELLGDIWQGVGGRVGLALGTLFVPSRFVVLDGKTTPVELKKGEGIVLSLGAAGVVGDIYSGVCEISQDPPPTRRSRRT